MRLRRDSLICTGGEDPYLVAFPLFFFRCAMSVDVEIHRRNISECLRIVLNPRRLVLARFDVP
jgi:hypothetical protein